MSWYNPLPYIGAPFILLWKTIKEGNSTLWRFINTILALLVLLFGLWVLMKWNEVPTYNHSILLNRIYSKESEKMEKMSAIYVLEMTSGGFFQDEENDPNAFFERFMFNDKSLLYRYTEGDSYTFIPKYKDRNPGFIEIAGEKAGGMLKKACDEKGLRIEDFAHGFYCSHKYQEDMARYNINESKITVIDTISMFGASYKSATISFETSSPFDSIPASARQFESIWTNTKPQGEFSFFLFSNYSHATIDRARLSNPRHKSLNRFLSFFKLKDITKSRYNISFVSNAIDSVTYIIRFKEAVSFSEMNVEPFKKDMNSLQFVSKDIESRVSLGDGVKFYVEYLETSNTQNIRVGLLTALLMLPLTLILKNLWALLKNVISTSSPKKGTVNEP